MGVVEKNVVVMSKMILMVQKMIEHKLNASKLLFMMNKHLS